MPKNDYSGCGCIIAVIVLNVIVGGTSVNYCLDTIAGKSIDFWLAGLVGLFIGEITIPGMIICWLLRIVGVHTPLLH